jgi:hypothetical protein
LGRGEGVPRVRGTPKTYLYNRCMLIGDGMNERVSDMNIKINPFY